VAWTPDQVVEAVELPGHRFALDLSLQATGAVSSSTHALDLSSQEESVRVRLQDGEIVPDRDCVISWQPRQEP